MINCPKCGAGNDSENDFCRFCGADLKSSPPPQQPSTPAPRDNSFFPQQEHSSVSRDTSFFPPETQPSVPPGTIECQLCGALNPSTNPYCSSCGDPLSTQPVTTPTPQQVVYRHGIPPRNVQSTSAPPKRGFQWWMLFAWPFLLIGAMFRCSPNSSRSNYCYGSSRGRGVDCGDCAECTCATCQMIECCLICV